MAIAITLSSFTTAINPFMSCKIMDNINKLCEISISYNKKTDVTPTIIKDSSSAESALRKAYLQSESQINLKEYFLILLLNRANHVIGYYKLSEGGLTGTVADLRLAFSVALKSLASGMIISHCHPSGNLKASQSDIQLTKKFKEAGILMNIPILDHVILTTHGYFSFADNGLL